MEIRSYRRVFNLERRVYSIDRLRLNPSGVPARGLLYFLATVGAALLLGSLPGVGLVVEMLPWYLRDLLLPGLAATVMGSVRVEGRTFHHAALALLRLGLRRRALLGGWRPVKHGRWYPHDVLVLPDGSDGRMRRMRYRGPGAVFVAVPHRRRGRAREHGSSAWARRGLGADVVLQEATYDGPQAEVPIVSLAPRATMRVRCSSRPTR
jgi:hypothetical protein